MTELLEGMDIDHDGKIEYAEFSAATMSTAEFLQEDKLHNAFEQLDLEGTGKIGKSDLLTILGGQGSTDAIIQNILERVDVDEDGGLDYPEFREMMHAFSQEVNGGEWRW